MDLFTPLKEALDFVLRFLDYVPIVRAIISFALILFLPGFAWTLVFFKRLKAVERIAFSFGLSLAIVTLSILVLNAVFKVRITGFNSLLVIILVTVIPLTIYYFNRARRNHSNGSPQILKKTKGSILRLLHRVVAWARMKWLIK